MNAALNRTLAVLTLAILALAPVARADDEKPADLKVGDAAPVFAGMDDQGQSWSSADHVGKKYLVVYFFPGDFTPGCTRQAQNFRDAMNKLTEKGVEVVGVSGDEVQTHQMFKKAQKLNFTLLSDAEGALAKTFGVPVGPGGQIKTKDADGETVTLKRAVTASRWTFVIGKDSKIVYKNTKVDPVKDAGEVADLIDRLGKP